MAPRSASSSSSSPSSSSSSSSEHQQDNYTITHRAPMERSQGNVQRGESSSSVSSEAYTRAEAREAILSSLVQILEQPLVILRKGTITDEQMRAESTLIPGSSLGKHLRHVHDHYRILLDSLESQLHADTLSMDYDKRMRVVPLETSVADALSEFERTQARVQHLLGSANAAGWRNDLDRRVKLTATTPAEVELGSTLGREMWFVCLHSIHHYALARVIMVHELGVQIDNSFGVAPSTMILRLWRQATEERAKL